MAHKEIDVGESNLNEFDTISLNKSASAFGKNGKDVASFGDAIDAVDAGALKAGAKKKAKGKKGDKDKDDDIPHATLRDLFRFANGVDWIMVTVGTVFAMTSGALFPLFAVLFGNTLNSFFPYDQAAINQGALNFLYLALGLGFASWVQYSLFAISAARQVQKLRGESLRATLKQEISWYDKSEANKVSSRIAGDTVIIQEGLGQKFGDFVKLFSQFIAGYVIGFTHSWKMTLVLMSALPLLITSMGLFAWALNRFTKKGQEAYAQAGGVVEETFGGIRTITAINLQKTMTDRYKGLIQSAEVVNVRGGLVTAVSIGSVMMTIFLTYALGWWYGGKLVYNQDPQVNNVGDVVQVFFSVMIGSMAMAQVGPNAKAVADALGALSSVLEILDRKSAIDSSDPRGEKPARITGNIQLKNVHFTYPSRPNAKILQGLSLNIKAGETIALVGASGSGKSTIISLLQRFYDIDEGSIDIDGTDLGQFNVRWLRSQMGLVSQEPILFSGTIADNIAYATTSTGKTATREEIVGAAIQANAHKFIESFPDGYDTTVGEKGVQLSGGQKQRIAIARAILRQPALLLLDEATSALDTESERVVQAALDELLGKKNCTCIVVAHRLSTIRNADTIAVFNNGAIAELGKHEELMAIEDGIYKGLVHLQLHSKQDETSEEDRKYSMVSVRSLRENLKSATSGKLSSMQGDGQVDDMEKGKGKLMSDTNVWIRLVMMNRKRWPIALVALLCAVASGAVFPVWALILTDMINTLGVYANDLDAMFDEIKHFSLIYVGFAVVVGLVNFVRINYYIYLGEKVTTELREITFEATVKQEIGFFDMDENSTGALAARLATEAKLVKAIAGETLGQLTQNASTLVVALFIAFVLGSWKISMVLLAIMPLLVFVSTFQARFLQQSMRRSQDHIIESGKRASEAIGSIRTVASFGLEDQLITNYYATLDVPRQQEQKKGLIGGASVGATMTLSFSAYALVFWYGGKLVGKGEITFDETMKSLMTIMFAALGLAQTSSFMTDTAAAKLAARKIFETVDRKSLIDGTSAEGRTLEQVRGEIELREVFFTYPSRPEQPILTGLSLQVKVGQTVALVGESGCGKSTVVSLMERFYDPDSGSVTLDGRDIRSLNPKWLRDQIGLVGQEPILFQGSIAANIAMGKPGGATQTEIEDAATLANAHEFIKLFPDGYNTEVGDRGVQLSGGQKQRIAIARAIVKNPPILMMDEATSALDAESEKVVQAALDKLLAAKRRTTLVIAHRLSTIKNADVIVFLKQGKVAEKGTHDTLMALNGGYAQLYKTVANH